MKIVNIFLAVFFFLGSAYAEDQGKRVVTATTGSDGVQRVEVTGGEYYFDPFRIIVKVNIPVEMSVRKESSYVPHDVIINAPEAGINVKEDIGKDFKIIKFTPTKEGTYPFYCDKSFLFFKNHREKGMEGILEVVP